MSFNLNRALITVFAPVAAAATLVGCDAPVMPEQPEAALARNGFTNIQYEITTPARCPAGTTVGQAISATAPDGRRVNGSICGNFSGGSVYIY